MRPDGFIYLDDLLAVKSVSKLNVDFAIIEHIVNNNDKKRFELKEEQNVKLIRAVQGHSMTQVKTEELLTKITNPFEYVQIIHGTYRDPLPLIMQTGLNRMGRNHSHLAIGLPGNGVISGMRASCQIVIEINMTKAMQGPDKVPFWISSNKVVLSEGIANGSIPAAYFRYVLDFSSKLYVSQTPFDYICVFDFECTCSNTEAIKLNS